MKAMFNVSVFALLLFTAASECFALQRNMIVAKDGAREMGVTFRSNLNGEAGVKVSIEFKPQGKLKNFAFADLTIVAGGKPLVSAPLLTSRPNPDSVRVCFSADPSYLGTTVLTIVVQEGEETRIGYQFLVKDFLEPEKSRQHRRT
jgi:hypothetical protein